MTKKFSSKDGTTPFPRNANEWMQKINPETGTYLTQQEADRQVAKDVFGHDYQTDKTGAPVERGKGSAAQPTAQHQQALAISQEAEISRKMRMGWHPGLEHAFNPRSAQPARRKTTKRRKTAAAPAEGSA